MRGGISMTAHRDLREWVQAFDDMGELRRAEGVDLNLELGAICDVASHKFGSPAILFQKIKGYEGGGRILVNHYGSSERAGLVLGITPDRNKIRMVEAWRKKIGNLPRIPPKVVTTGPIQENVFRGAAADLFKLPIPLWHELDGGRYIGTGCVVITRDPEDGWINLGTYRGMVHDASSIGLHITPARHARAHRDKYFQKKEPFPVAIVCGCDLDLLTFSQISAAPYGVSEYDYAGGLRGEPIEVVLGEYTGLPIPASAEIAIEGECISGDMKEEGPFGEWSGYYGSGGKAEQVVRVKTLMYRNDPIMNGWSPVRPPTNTNYLRAIIKSGSMWDALEKGGVPEIKGVWCHEVGASWLFNVISIKQRYPGHAKQAALLMSQCQEGVSMGRFIIVVDEDIDPANLEEVIWAMCTRCNPETSIDIIRRCSGSFLDPVYHKKGAVPYNGLNSRVIIEACKPFEWMNDFPQAVNIGPEMKNEIETKWEHLFK
jgi:UbiD family decarboxylase